MLTELLERLFARNKKENSRASAKRRLQIVLAHDRTDLSPAVVDQMRQEILEVVSRYVEIDQEESEFSLESDQRTTALIANLRIRKIKDSTEPQSEVGGENTFSPPPALAPEEVLELSDETELSSDLLPEELNVATAPPEAPQKPKPIDRSPTLPAVDSETTKPEPSQAADDQLPKNPPKFL